MNSPTIISIAIIIKAVEFQTAIGLSICCLILEMLAIKNINRDTAILVIDITMMVHVSDSVTNAVANININATNNSIKIIFIYFILNKDKSLNQYRDIIII